MIDLWKSEIHAFSILKDECLEQGYTIFIQTPKSLQSLKVSWDMLPPIEKQDFVSRVIEEDHLIKLMK